MADRPPASGSPPKLLDRVRQAIRLRHYSRRTEQAYIGWIRRFIVFHGKRHPRELGEREVTAFLSRLATGGVSASTQNQALSAILFLYKVVVGERVEADILQNSETVSSLSRSAYFPGILPRFHRK